MSKKKAAEEGNNVPAYIVTFSDMVTLLLTFFVMLLSMAEEQVEDHKFMSGKASLQRAMSDFGLSGFLMNRSNSPQFDDPNPKYLIEEGDDEKEDRSLNAHTEKLRRLLMDIETKMKISPSHITGISKAVLTTEIQFDPDSSILNTNHQKLLNQYWHRIQASVAGQKPAVYVLGVANKAESERQQWFLSAQRAQSVADYLSSLQKQDDPWPIYSWGAGNGGQWTEQNGLTNVKSQIVLAVLTEKK